MDEVCKQIEQFFNEHSQKAYSVDELYSQLHLEEIDFSVLVKALLTLEKKGFITLEKNNHWKKAQLYVVEGVFHGNEKGFGFVDCDEFEDSIYISPEHTLYAMTGDTVQVKILRGPHDDRGAEGKVTNIVERGYDQVVGEFKSKSEPSLPDVIGEIILKDKKLKSYTCYVNRQTSLSMIDGDIVTADIITYPNSNLKHGIVVVGREIIGDVSEPGVDILQILYAHKVPVEFPQSVLDEANAIPDTVQECDKKGRVDLTNQPFITIDSIESKDLDDAVVVWRKENGNYHLGVSIADVSYYVKEGSELDKEAYRRGTSVYLVDRVVPMLPKKLSNGICSLNEGVERLTMTCDMEIDAAGNIVSHKIYPSFIRSHARMTYKAVNAILDKDDAQTKAKYQDLVDMFYQMRDLHHILAKQRETRGAIEFDAPEAKIIVDDTGHPIDIKLRERGTSERMIESFMLAANETVAKHFHDLHVPFLYRIHENPDEEKVKSFFELLSVFGINAKGDPRNLKPKVLQKVLQDVAGTPEEQMVQTMMLRSMQQAKYSDQPVGHFGIGASDYTHFTSPIRRYPDDMVHRLIRWYEANGVNENSKSKYFDKLAQIAIDTSNCERRGVDTERATDDLKKAEYMADHVGEDFEAVVSSVLKFGMFVELPNTVEGLVHISNMTDDFYDYDETHMALIGEKHHHIFQIGQPIKVHLDRVDVEYGNVDFSVIDPDSAPTTDIKVRSQKQRTSRNKNSRRNRDDKNKHNNHYHRSRRHKSFNERYKNKK